jgi:DNA-binding transcriptional LysR family regulator
MVMAMDRISQLDRRIGRRIRLRELHILLGVVQSGSMAKAAQLLAMSQPAVSKAIADLEQALGVRLLDRGPKGVEPTSYGRALARRGAVVFDELRHGVGEIEFLADPSVGEVRLACGEPVGATLVAPVIERLSLTRPGLVFHVTTANTITLEFQELRERKLDLMIGRIVTPFAEDDLWAEPLFGQSIVVVAGAQSRWARRRSVELAELVEEKWILLPPDTPHSTYVVSAFRARGLEPPRATVTSNLIRLREALVATGHFLSAFPAELLHPYKGRHPAIKVLPVNLGPPQPIAIVTMKNRTLSPAVELFIDCARTVAKSMALHDLRLRRDSR